MADEVISTLNIPSKVWLVDPKTRNLKSAFERDPELDLILPAQPFSVSILTCTVFEDLESFFRGDNDILILTSSTIGDKAPVERVHFWEKEIPAGTTLSNLLSETIFITEDYSAERLWLEFKIIEVDTDDGERKAAIETFRSMVSFAGSAFPILARVSNPATAVIKAINKLIGVIEKDTFVIKVPFSLFPLHPDEQPRVGRSPLQTGTYVVFAKDVRGSAYRMSPEGQIVPGNGVDNVSYITFDITAKQQPSPEFLVNQKLATLLTQLHFGNERAPKTTIDFLEETMRYYKNFSELERYRELRDKPSKTPSEQERMDEIAKNLALKPYLS